MPLPHSQSTQAPSLMRDDPQWLMHAMDALKGTRYYLNTNMHFTQSCTSHARVPIGREKLAIVHFRKLNHLLTGTGPRTQLSVACCDDATHHKFSVLIKLHDQLNTQLFGLLRTRRQRSISKRASKNGWVRSTASWVHIHNSEVEGRQRDVECSHDIFWIRQHLPLSHIHLL